MEMKNIVVIGAIATVVFAAVGSYVSAANIGNQFEQQIKYKFRDNENVLAQYGQKVTEMAGVTGLAATDLQKTIKEAISGRYGDGGVKAAMVMITEQNPTIDAALYRNIQTTISAGRDRFESAQTQRLSICQSYETKIGTVFGGMMMRIAGYPRIDLEGVMCKPVSTARADEAFRTGIESTPLLKR